MQFPSDLLGSVPGPPTHPPTPGWIAPDVSEEHPGLALFHWTVGTTWRRRSSPVVRNLLSGLSTRVDGPTVLKAHREEAPAAHRELLRRIGRDPDEDPAPQELAYRRRIKDGGFPIRSTPSDLLMVVLVETGVPVFALDADRVDGDLGLRRSLQGELPVPDGVDPSRRRPEPVLVDADGVVAEILREPPDDRIATRRSGRTTFYCVRVPGLSDLRVEEAVWLCQTLMEHEA